MTLPPQYAADVQSLLLEIKEQRAQMNKNQAAIEEKLKGIAENVREAKIFSRRGAR